MFKKSTKKIINTVGVLILSLIILLNLDAPLSFLAATSDERATDFYGFTSPTFQLFRYNQGQMFYGGAATPTQSITYNFNSQAGLHMDNSNINMRFNFAFGVAGPQLDSFCNLYGKTYNITFDFGCKNYNNGKVYSLVPEKILQSVMSINYVDGTKDTFTADISISQPANGGTTYSLSLDLYGFRDEMIESMALSLFFNFHDAYGIDPTLTTVNAMDMYVASISHTDITPEKIPVPDIPVYDLPEVDADGIPNLENYSPDGTKLGETLNILTSYPPILLMMIIPVGIGVVGYVLFGKR